MSIPILRVRDQNGNYVNIPAIQGPPGKGDMEAAAYDPSGAVAKAGGIAAYVQQNGGSGGGGGSGDMDATTYDPNGTVAQAGGIEAYVSELVGDIDTVLDSVNGEMTSALDSALDEINGEVV